jgi:hypothetical protein
VVALLNRPRVYRIDIGDFEIISFQSIFHITRKFFELGPLAIKASLASKYLKNKHFIYYENILIFIFLRYYL